MLRSIVPVGILFAAVSAAAFAQEEEDVVYLVRKPISLNPADDYRVAIALEPKTTVTLTATTSGPVQTVLCTLGEKVTGQSELVRVDSEEQRLLVERAQAAVNAAQSSDGGAAKAAEVEVAQLDLKLAQLRLERTKSVAPFPSQVVDVHVVPGQYVRESDPLVTLIDQSVLRAKIPVEREGLKVGDTVPVNIEGKPYDAKVSAIIPLQEQFEPLRDLFASVATAVVEFDNGAGQLQAGQTVRSELMPLDPVTEVPNTAVSTDSTGTRRVFVIRKDVAISVPVQVLGALNENRTFVAGEFAIGDELVAEGGESLVHGRRIVPVDQAGTVTAGGAGRARPQGAAPYDDAEEGAAERNMRLRREAEQAGKSGGASSKSPLPPSTGGF